MHTPTPIPSLIATWTSIPYPIPNPYPQPVSPTARKPPAISSSTPTLELPGVLNRKDPLSLVRWLQYGLENQNVSFINPLLADNIWYSLAFSDLIGETLSKEVFLEQLKRRLSNHLVCLSYVFHFGESNRLSISTAGWSPSWEFYGRESNYLILDFSDQWTKQEGLYLFGAYVNPFGGVIDPNEIPCH
jgi:hypothetical protein